MKTIQRVSIFLLLIFSFNTFSQENDFQSWSSFKIGKKIYKRTNLTAKEGMRIRENSTLLSKVFTDLKISHRIKKTDLRLGIGYRFSNEFNFDFSSDFSHRYYLDQSWEYNYKRYKISFRNRFQYQGNTSYRLLDRKKVEIAYNVRKTPFEPFFQFESFISVNAEFEKLRYTLGFDCPIVKDLDLVIFYRIQQDLNTNNPEYLYILGTSLNYKL